jgi:3-dehydroshikimate dehydratase
VAKAGLCTIGFSKKSIDTALDIAARAGADGVEIWGQPDHVRYPVEDVELRGIREHAEALALEICALGSYFRAGATTEYARVKLDARNQVRIARELGAPLIRIWAGSKARAECAETEVHRVIDDIRQFADHAGDARIRVVLERHNGSLTHGWDGVPELLEEIHHENVSLNYQIVDPATEEELQDQGVEDFTRLVPLSGHAHMHNYLPLEDGTLKRCFLDSGLVDYSSLGHVARSARYKGYFMVEFPPELNEGLSEVDTIRRDIDFLRGLR